MGISKPGYKKTARAPRRAALVKVVAGVIAGSLIGLSSSKATAAPDIVSPFAALDIQDAQDRTTTSPAATQPATTVVPSTAPFLASPPPHTNDEAGDAGAGNGEIVPIEQPRGPLRFSFTGVYMYGSVKGMAQHPVGGQQHTANLNRPSYSAIGIEEVGIADGEVAIGFGEHQEVFFGAQYNHMSGNGVLTKSLVSDGVTFPTRTQVHANIRMDWYRLGYRYQFVLNTAQNNVPDLTVTPFLDAFYWDYGYDLDGGRVGSAGRSLTKFGMQIGGTLAWRPYGGPLSIELTAAGFPQISQLANVSQESIILRYQFYRYKHFDFNVLLGVAWQQESLEDSKFPIPNKVEADFGPMLLTGLNFRF